MNHGGSNSHERTLLAVRAADLAEHVWRKRSRVAPNGEAVAEADHTRPLTITRLERGVEDELHEMSVTVSSAAPRWCSARGERRALTLPPALLVYNCNRGLRLSLPNSCTCAKLVNSVRIHWNPRSEPAATV